MFGRRDLIKAGTALAITTGLPATAVLAQTGGRVSTLRITSDKFRQNKIGLGDARNISVYLPEGYEAGTSRYPVAYFLPNLFDNDQTMFTQGNAKSIFDEAINKRLIRPFIGVSIDFSTPLGSSLYVDSSVTGNWEQFMFADVIPFVDRTFRTFATTDARAIVGDRMGGNGAIRFAMRHPDVLGSVYALHPVGTGYGVQIMQGRPNWDVLWNAKSLDDAKADVFSQIFTAIYQAHLPNPVKPPLYVDLPARRVNGQLVMDAALTDKLQNSFFLERMIPRYADNLKKLRGFKFDWGRNDGNYDHIISNQAFTQQLDEYGISYEAEEYNGSWGERHWGPDGRVMTDVLPFLARHLRFS